MKKIGEITAFDTKLALKTTQYTHSKQRALLLEDAVTGEPWATVTTNIFGAELADNEICVKTWSENEPFREPLLATGLFEDTGRRIPTGNAEAEVWRIR